MGFGVKYQFQPLGDEYQFEEFIKDLFNKAYNTDSFQAYKGKGANQHGIDVYSNVLKIYVQCKKKDIGRAKATLERELLNDLQESIEMLPGLPFFDNGFTFILASTVKEFNIEDAAAQLAIKHQALDATPRLKDIRYLGWDKIEQWLHEQPALRQKYYPSYTTKNLTAIPSVDSSEVVGRDVDLKNITELIKADRPLLLVNGLGGIGKTTLAKYYVKENAHSYDHIAWITVGEDFGTALLADPMLLNKLGLTNLDEQQRKHIVEYCLDAMEQLGGKNLLVIDNATKNILAYSDHLGSLTNWKILLTSREELKGLKAIPYRLDLLDETYAMRLFREHYTYEAVADDDLQKVLALIGRHTMTIKLLAKTFDAAGRTFDEMRKRLETQGLKFSQIHADDHDYKIWDADKKAWTGIEPANIDQWVKTLFAWDETTMPKAEETLLMYFSVTPPYNYSIDWLAALFEMNEQAKREELINHLNSLARKGWLDKQTENGIGYKCHAVVQHAVREKTKPDWENCLSVVESVIALISIDQDKDNPVDKFPFAEFGEMLLHYLEGEADDKSLLKNELGILYQNIGNYAKAEQILTEDLLSSVGRLGESHPIVASSRSNLAIVYQDLGRYEEARVMLELALVADIKNFGKNHSKIRIRLSNLATVYQNLGEYEKARDLQEIALAEELKHSGNWYSIAAYRSNLGLIYSDLKNYEKAKQLLEQALAAVIEHFGEVHPKVSTSRSNLATIHVYLGEYDEARKLLECALEAEVEYFGDAHPEVAISRSNLAIVYQHLSDYEKARNLLELALAADIEHFGEIHPSVATRYSNLANVLSEMGAFEESVERLLKAYQIALQCWGPEHPSSKVIEEGFQYIQQKRDKAQTGQPQ